jgi:hypothetical protein
MEKICWCFRECILCGMLGNYIQNSSRVLRREGGFIIAAGGCGQSTGEGVVEKTGREERKVAFTSHINIP